jgi:hypothetical protein
VPSWSSSTSTWPKVEVLALELRQYIDEHGQHETLVPTLVGETQAARQAKKRTKQKYPSVPIMGLADSNTFDAFASTIDWVLRDVLAARR